MKTKLIFFIILNIFICFELRASNVIVSTQSAYKGDEVVFELSIQDAQNDVKSFGIDINYSTDELKFKPDDYEIGPLLEQGYGYLEIKEQSPGFIRIGWFCMLNYKIPKHASGIIAKLKFVALKCKDSKLKIVSLQDHIKDWHIQHGFFNIKENAFCWMDTDGDNKIGLREIINLMKYLSK